MGFNKESIMPNQRWIGLLLVVGLLLWAAPAATGEGLTPTETIQGPLNDVILILKDPAFQAPGTKTAQRAAIWKRVRPIFDFKEISRKTIGTELWNTFSKAEQEQFADVFAELLGNTYIDKIQGEYKDEKIIFTKEKVVKGRLARVFSKLVRQGIEIPIDYIMMKHNDGQWLVFDILIENGDVSLVTNFKIEYRSALQKITPAQLIQNLEAKVLEQQKPSGNS
jgi:phospholipid transport system substrate-binding protein